MCLCAAFVSTLADEQALELHDAHVAQVRISLVRSERGDAGAERLAAHQPVVSEWGYLAELRHVAEASPPVTPAPEGRRWERRGGCGRGVSYASEMLP